MPEREDYMMTFIPETAKDGLQRFVMGYCYSAAINNKDLDRERC